MAGKDAGGRREGEKPLDRGVEGGGGAAREVDTGRANVGTG